MVINVLAVICAAIVNMVIGALWYGPFFGKAWMDAMGYKKKDISKLQKEGQKSYKWAFLTSLLMASVLGWFVGLFQERTIMTGLQLGFMFWLGLVVPTAASNVLWAGKNPKVYKIDMGYYLVSLLVITALLAAWA